MNAKKAEILTSWYLRFNGYFIVDNFILHNPAIVSKDTVANSTEIDTLGVRNQYSREMAGDMPILNDPALINANNPRIDFVIAEVKTGKEDRPNRIWRDRNIEAIAYILRFAGFIETETEIIRVANEVAVNGSYLYPDGRYAIRLILFCETPPNKHWKQLHNISLDHIVDFLLNIRGQCWIESAIGVKSIHYQWHELINAIFEIANDQSVDIQVRKQDITNLLST